MTFEKITELCLPIIVTAVTAGIISGIKAIFTKKTAENWLPKFRIALKLTTISSIFSIVLLVISLIITFVTTNRDINFSNIKDYVCLCLLILVTMYLYTFCWIIFIGFLGRKFQNKRFKKNISLILATIAAFAILWGLAMGSKSEVNYIVSGEHGENKVQINFQEDGINQSYYISRDTEFKMKNLKNMNKLTDLRTVRVSSPMNSMLLKNTEIVLNRGTQVYLTKQSRWIYHGNLIHSIDKRTIGILNEKVIAKLSENTVAVLNDNTAREFEIIILSLFGVNILIILCLISLDNKLIKTLLNFSK